MLMFEIYRFAPQLGDIFKIQETSGIVSTHTDI